MSITGLLLKLISNILPVPALDRYLNRSLPDSPGAFKRFSQIDPAIFEFVSRKKILYMFDRAWRLIPAYKKFLDNAGVDPQKIKNIEDFDNLVPPTTKDNYIKVFPLHERCILGKYPDNGFIEESAGTTGKSSFWIRSAEEEQNNMLLMKAAMKHLYGSCGDRQSVIINAMTLGGWSGGLRFASRVGSLGIVKNTGPDPHKIIRCLKELGTDFTYLIGGYPPFIIELVEYGKKQSDFDWKNYRINVFPGGEGFVEKWREYVSSNLAEGALIFSVYGAIDLDVGISVETPFTVAIRKLIQTDSEFHTALLGSDRIPCFIGQASNQQFYVREITGNGGAKELEITVMNPKAVSPNIKYVIGDEGGVVRFAEIIRILEESGYSVQKIKNEFKIQAIVPFPLLYLYGRTDGTVTINGALVSPSEIYEVIYSDKELAASYNTFKLSVEPDSDNYIKFFIWLETRDGIYISDALLRKTNELITESLIASNECFRNSYRKNPGVYKPVITVVPFGTGIFSAKDSSVKNIYFNTGNDGQL